MLDTINLLIGLSVVMLVVSFAVTLLTELTVTTFNLRGQALRRGVAELLVNVDSGIGPADARAIAELVLRDPLIGPPNLIGNGRRLAPVVHREELVRLLLVLARNPATQQAPAAPAAAPSGDVMETPQSKLRASLDKNGIAEPDAVLAAIRKATLDLEKTSPQLSNSARANIAILNFASSEFLAKITGWFDQSMDRVADNFTGWTRFVAVAAAVVVAFWIQLDSIGLINRLSANSELRDSLVSWAEKNADKLDTCAAEQKCSLTLANAAKGALDPGELIALPTAPCEWWGRWSGPVQVNGKTLPQVHLPGVLLSAALLSLGGPFWYEALKNLLKLRSVVAGKDDDQRQERQSTQAAPSASGKAGEPASGALLPALSGGEAGDLSKTG